jgi:hypothetical protein
LFGGVDSLFHFFFFIHYLNIYYIYVLVRFGPGPHRVEITYALGYLDSHNNNAVEDTRPRYNFVVQLAPLDAVPHAIHLFLEQVEHGLLTGTYFYLNGPHIVQAGPQLDEDEHFEYEDVKTFDENGQITNNDGDPVHVAAAKSLHVWSARTAEEEGEDDDEGNEFAQEDRRMRRFAEMGLDKLAFPDYSPEFPHVPWTLGYTGRPGGPDWYINKVDNTKGHGPGGQHQHALEEQGDSCFGFVEEGQGRTNLAMHLFGGSIYNDRTEWHYFLEEPVEIVQAVILTKQPQVSNINMGMPLHRRDFIHDDAFGTILNDALESPRTNPAEADPNNANNGAAEAQVGSEGQTTGGTNDMQQQQQNAAEANNQPQNRDRRKPRIPKIEGQAEA